MRNKLILLLAALLLCTLAACGKPEASDDGGGLASLPETAAPLEDPQESDMEGAEVIARGANDFALRLSAAVMLGVEETVGAGANFVCSPYAVWLPLAALSNATAPAAQDALLASLNVPGIRAEELNRAVSRMLFDLTGQREREYDLGETASLHLANAIFVSEDFTLREEFGRIFYDFYRGAASQLDFRDPASADVMNSWAAEQTKGLIDSIVGALDPNAAATIASAIYFSDRWSYAFDPAETREDTFTTREGESLAQYMYRDDAYHWYYEDESLQAISLSMQKGALWVLLPREQSAEELLASLDMDYFDTIRAIDAHSTGRLLLPKFQLDTGLRLGDVLSALGVPLFDGAQAALTGGLVEGETPLFLTDAVQKAIIDVNEEGVTAGAVTVMDAGMGGPEPTEPFEMICNKPFVFLLTGYTCDGGELILFSGIVNDPSR